jgi:peptidoglycan/xylan/chitin deacetylase (PgdA/CDA1 family)
MRDAGRRTPGLKHAAFRLYKHSGAARAAEGLHRRAAGPFMAVLLFHRVTDAIPPDGLTVPPALFRAVCGVLRRGFHVVGLGEVFDTLRRGLPVRPRTVAITFDDCYRDNLAAARVLAEHGLPATFFVPTGVVGTDRVLPWDRGLPRQPNLTWDHVRAMADMGFEIGSHTVNHLNLGAVTPDQARAEIIGSKLTLQERLGRPVRWFAYPFGGPEQFRVEYLPLLDEAGYAGCVSACPGFVRPGCDDRVLPREAVPYFRSALHLELYLSGALGWYYGLKRRLGLHGGLPRFTAYGEARPRADARQPARCPVENG